MEIELVVAMAGNGEIGREGGLPWRLSTDLKRFKAITMGKPVVMGRKTWESIGRPLPGRLNVVMTRQRGFREDGAEVADTLDEALRLAVRGEPDSPAVAIIGGGEIFELAMPLADRLHVTHVLADVEGDTRFPDIDAGIWEAVHAEDVPAGEKDVYPTRYVVYERRTKA